jgi:hypothetical protein
VTALLVLSSASLVSALARTSRPRPRSSAAGYCRDLQAVFSEKRPFVGVDDMAFMNASTGYKDCTAGQFAADGVAYFRYPLTWDAIELAPGKYDFSIYDALVALLAKHHVRYFPVLLGVPNWDARRVRLYYGQHPPPAHFNQFANFAAMIVRRYGPGGSFWKLYPTIPYTPIEVWQVWNEPNLVTYWPPRPDPPQYAQLLRVTYKAIKGVDPHADVVTAGMPYFGPPPSPTALGFYDAVFRAGALRSFDSIGFNAYAPTPASALAHVEAVRALMNRYGLRQRSIWLTEFGWASDGPPSPYTARGGIDQRNRLIAFMHDIARYRGQLRLRGIMLWSWADTPSSEIGGADYWGIHAGLYTLSQKAKPALSAFASASLRLSR